MGAKKFVRNLSRLWSTDLSVPLTSSDIDDQMICELKDRLARFVVPNVMDREETVDYILEKRCSVARFGDGEFEMMRGGSAVFQVPCEALAQKLKEAFVAPSPNCLPCFYHYYFHSVDHLVEAPFARSYGSRVRQYILSVYNPELVYGDSGFALGYSSFLDLDYERHYAHLRRIWEDRSIVMVSGQNILHELDYNLFDNASSIDYIDVPRCNAFAGYDDVKARVVALGANKLVIAACGPMATVLCNELAGDGVQALDLGHLAQDYNAYKTGVVRDKTFRRNFWLPD